MSQDHDCGDCVQLAVCTGALACACGPTGKMFIRRDRDRLQADLAAMRADGMPADRDALQAMLDAAYNKGRDDVHGMHQTGAPLALVKAERDALASLIRLRYPRLLGRGNPLYDATLAAAIAQHEQPGGTA